MPEETKLVLPVVISRAAASASRVTKTVCLGNDVEWHIHPRRSAITRLGTLMWIQSWFSGTALVMSPVPHAGQACTSSIFHGNGFDARFSAEPDSYTNFSA